MAFLRSGLFQSHRGLISEELMMLCTGSPIFIIFSIFFSVMPKLHLHGLRNSMTDLIYCTILAAGPHLLHKHININWYSRTMFNIFSV